MKGILLLNLGGPDSLGSIQPFLNNLFRDRDIIRLGPSPLQGPLAWIISFFRSKKTRKNYRLIGGKSPLFKITSEQARTLEKRLNKGGLRFKVYVGMRYWHPFISEALEEATNDGVRTLYALPLFPHYSRATTGSCFNELDRALEKSVAKLDIKYIQSWYAHPLYIKALAQTIEEAFLKFSKGERESVGVVFSAHALPKKFIEEGDPYVDQINGTIRAVADLLELKSWKLSFQSRSGPVEWIGPETTDTVRELAEGGVKKLIIVPISFVSDHFETLYEIDIMYKKEAERLGVTLVRADSLNTRPEFIEAIGNLVEQADL
jgi:ferrochelatase